MKFRALFLSPLIFLANIANAQVNLAPPRTVWDSDVDGTALHRISTLQCPPSSGEFRRFNIQLYDKVGFDVGCDYRMGNAEITLYLTRIDPTKFAENFESAKNAVFTNRTGATPRDGTLPLPAGAEWKRASFILSNGMISDVVMAPLHGWSFKMRVSYLPERADSTATALADLTALTLKTAGQHLAACEGRSPTPTDGKRIVDKGKLDALTILAGLLLLGPIKNVDGSDGAVSGREAAAPLLSCADGGFSVGGDNFVFWQDGSAQRVTAERITGIERNFMAAASALLSDALAKSSGAPMLQSGSAGPQIAVVVDRGSDWDVMAFFEGLPDMKEMAEAAVLGQPVARASKSDGKISLFTGPAAK